jgi:Protein of unknown function (DUF1366)
MKKIFYLTLLFVCTFRSAIIGQMPAPQTSFKLMSAGANPLEVSTEEAERILQNWKVENINPLLLRNDLLVIDSLEMLLTRIDNSDLKIQVLKEKLKFLNFHKLAIEIQSTQNRISELEKAALDSKMQSLSKERDSLLQEIVKWDNKHAFAQEMNNQLIQEKQIWIYTTSGLAGATILLFIILLITISRRRKQNVPTPEKEVVIKEQKVIVHEPHPDHAESAQKITELEKLYRNSLNTIHIQEGEKKEAQAHLMQVVDTLREAQQELKRIQENKQMTAEDFMRLSNAVQRSISHLSKK